MSGAPWTHGVQRYQRQQGRQCGDHSEAEGERTAERMLIGRGPAVNASPGTHQDRLPETQIAAEPNSARTPHQTGAHGFRVLELQVGYQRIDDVLDRVSRADAAGERTQTVAETMPI